LIWRFTLVLIKINNGQIGEFGTKFKLVFCAKYDKGLDLGFWEILKPLKWTNEINLIFICFKLAYLL
jgi:hypothetical protein